MFGGKSKALRSHLVEHENTGNVFPLQACLSEAKELSYSPFTPPLPPTFDYCLATDTSFPLEHACSVFTKPNPALIVIVDI